MVKPALGDAVALPILISISTRNSPLGVPYSRLRNDSRGPSWAAVAVPKVTPSITRANAAPRSFKSPPPKFPATHKGQGPHNRFPSGHLRAARMYGTGTSPWVGLTERGVASLDGSPR